MRVWPLQGWVYQDCQAMIPPLIKEFMIKITQLISTLLTAPFSENVEAWQLQVSLGYPSYQPDCVVKQAVSASVQHPTVRIPSS